mmetsp:Transcript_9219/g.27763  ORF Transcript_9219/g.27763 Transcript_9219/m.27763 type:complete len:284 (-) Transcript_9219:1224-2075(-)
MCSLHPAPCRVVQPHMPPQRRHHCRWRACRMRPLGGDISSSHLHQHPFQEAEGRKGWREQSLARKRMPPFSPASRNSVQERATLPRFLSLLARPQGLRRPAPPDLHQKHFHLFHPPFLFFPPFHHSLPTSLPLRRLQQAFRLYPLLPVLFLDPLSPRCQFLQLHLPSFQTPLLPIQAQQLAPFLFPEHSSLPPPYPSPLSELTPVQLSWLSHLYFPPFPLYHPSLESPLEYAPSFQRQSLHGWVGGNLSPRGACRRCRTRGMAPRTRSCQRETSSRSPRWIRS